MPPAIGSAFPEIANTRRLFFPHKKLLPAITPVLVQKKLTQKSIKNESVK